MYYCIQILECFSAIWNLYSKTAVQIVYMYSFESKIKKSENSPAGNKKVYKQMFAPALSSIYQEMLLVNIYFRKRPGIL